MDSIIMKAICLLFITILVISVLGITACVIVSSRSERMIEELERKKKNE